MIRAGTVTCCSSPVPLSRSCSLSASGSSVLNIDMNVEVSGNQEMASSEDCRLKEFEKFFQENTCSYRMDSRVWWSVDDNQMYLLGFRFDAPFRVLKWLEFGSSNFGHI